MKYYTLLCYGFSSLCFTDLKALVSFRFQIYNYTHARENYDMQENCFQNFPCYPSQNNFISRAWKKSSHTINLRETQFTKRSKPWKAGPADKYRSVSGFDI